jgi:hypothetical protein
MRRQRQRSRQCRCHGPGAPLPRASGILPFLGPIGLIAAGVGAVVLVWKKWDTITDIAMQVYTGVKEWLVDKFAMVVKWIGEKVGQVTGFFRNMYDAVVGNSFVPDMINRIAEEFAKLPSIMVAPAQGAADQVANAFAGMKERTDTTWAGIMDQIRGVFESADGSISKIFTGFASGPLDGLMAKIDDSFGPRASDAMQTLQQIFRDGSKVVSGVLRGLSGDVTGWVQATLSAIDLVRNAWNGIKMLLGGGEEGVLVNPARDQFFAQYGGYEGLAGKLTAASDGNVAEQLIRTLYDAETMGAFRSAEEAIIALIGGQAFAKGGIVTRPTLGVFGERGPEAVIPLDRLPDMLGRPIEITVVSQLDGLTIAKATARHWPRALSHAGLA